MVKRNRKKSQVLDTSAINLLKENYHKSMLKLKAIEMEISQQKNIVALAEKAKAEQIQDFVEKVNLILDNIDIFLLDKRLYNKVIALDEEMSGETTPLIDINSYSKEEIKDMINTKPSRSFFSNIWSKAKKLFQKKKLKIARKKLESVLEDQKTEKETELSEIKNDTEKAIKTLDEKRTRLEEDCKRCEDGIYSSLESINKLNPIGVAQYNFEEMQKLDKLSAEIEILKAEIEILKSEVGIDSIDDISVLELSDISEKEIYINNTVDEIAATQVSINSKETAADKLGNNAEIDRIDDEIFELEEKIEKLKLNILQSKREILKAKLEYRESLENSIFMFDLPENTDILDDLMKDGGLFLSRILGEDISNYHNPNQKVLERNIRLISELRNEKENNVQFLGANPSLAKIDPLLSQMIYRCKLLPEYSANELLGSDGLVRLLELASVFYSDGHEQESFFLLDHNNDNAIYVSYSDMKHMLNNQIQKRLEDALNNNEISLGKLHYLCDRFNLNELKVKCEARIVEKLQNLRKQVRKNSVQVPPIDASLNEIADIEGKLKNIIEVNKSIYEGLSDGFADTDMEQFLDHSDDICAILSKNDFIISCKEDKKLVNKDNAIRQIADFIDRSISGVKITDYSNTKIIALYDVCSRLDLKDNCRSLEQIMMIRLISDEIVKEDLKDLMILEGKLNIEFLQHILQENPSNEVLREEVAEFIFLLSFKDESMSSFLNEKLDNLKNVISEQKENGFNSGKLIKAFMLVPAKDLQDNISLSYGDVSIKSDYNVSDEWLKGFSKKRLLETIKPKNLVEVKTKLFLNQDFDAKDDDIINDLNMFSKALEENPKEKSFLIKSDNSVVLLSTQDILNSLYSLVNKNSSEISVDLVEKLFEFIDKCGVNVGDFNEQLTSIMEAKLLTFEVILGEKPSFDGNDKLSNLRSMNDKIESQAIKLTSPLNAIAANTEDFNKISEALNENKDKDLFVIKIDDKITCANRTELAKVVQQSSEDFRPRI